MSLCSPTQMAFINKVTNNNITTANVKIDMTVIDGCHISFKIYYTDFSVIIDGFDVYHCVSGYMCVGC